MKSLEVKINQSFPPAYELFLFNRADQIILQKAEQLLSFQLVSDKLSYADFNVFIKGHEAFSPIRAPFGSIQFHPDLSSKSLEDFIDEVLKYLKEYTISKIKIVNYPDCYSSHSRKLDDLFFAKGFEILVTELNYHLPVEGTYESQLHDSELRRLKKCESAAFQLKIGREEYLNEMYEQIRETRGRKGFPLSMEMNDIQKLFKLFPYDYYSFTLWDKNELIASSIGVRISSEILYYFLPADNPNYKNYSPTVLLIKGMYDFCQNNNYKILDLGISTSGGIRNEGLIRFKENLGSILTNKYTFEKKML